MEFERNTGQGDAYAEAFAGLYSYTTEQLDCADANEMATADVLAEETPYSNFDVDIINDQVSETGDQVDIATGVVEITPDETLSVTINRLDEIDQTMAPILYDAIYEAVSKLSDKNTDGFYETVDREVAKLDRETTDFERLEVNYRVLKRRGGQVPVMETDETQQLVAEAAELRSQADSLAVNVYMRSRDELIDAVDWQAVIEHTVQEGDFACGRLAKLFNSFNAHSSPAMRHGYKNTMRWISSLEHWQERFIDSGHVLAEGTGQFAPDDWQPNTQLIIETHGWREAVQEVKQLMSDKRAAHLSSALLKQRDLDTFETFFFGIGMEAMNPDRDGVARPVAYALEQYVANRIQAVYKVDKEYRDRPGADQPRVVLGPYRDRLQTLLGVDRPQDFFRDTLKRFPASLIRHMDMITCVDSLDPISYPDGRVESAAASMNSVDNTMRLNMAPRVVADMIDVDKGLDPSTASDVIQNALRRDRQALNRAALRKIIDHETAHHIVHETSPLEWLVRMHQTAAQEAVDVATYVTNSRTRGRLEGQHEDYAASGALYMNHPWTLYQMAPQRFDTYHTLIDRYAEEDLWASSVCAIDDSTDERLGQDRLLAERANKRAQYGAMLRRRSIR
jgi:hypothetical protein